MVFHAIKKISDALKLFSFEGDDFFLIVFLKYRDKLTTKQTSSDKLEIPCGTKFLRVLIFTSFRIFPSAIRKNKFPQKIIKRKHFSRKNLLQSIKYTLTKIYYTKNRTTKSCLFNYNSPPQFRNKTVYNELVLNGVRIPRSTVWKSVYPLQLDCTYLTRTKILSMPGTGCFLKINSQQEKPTCPSVVNAVRPFFRTSQF